MPVHGDVAFLVAPEGAFVPELINLIDRSTLDDVAYSHVGLVCQGGNMPQMLLSMTHERGLVYELLAPLVAGRGARFVTHPDGVSAADEAVELSVDPVDYDYVQLALAAVAALLRARGEGRSARDRLWETIHRASRNLVGAQFGNCPHLIPGPDVPHWYCASFVDHAFRAAGACLCVAEPCAPNDRRFGLAVASFNRVVTYLRRVVDRRASRPAAMYVIRRPDGDGEPIVNVVRDPDPDPDDGGLINEPLAFRQIDANDVAADLIAAADPERADDDELTYLLHQLIADLDWTLGFLDHSFFALNYSAALIGVLAPDSHRAPWPCEPMWPPFMSLRLMMERLT